MARFSDSDQEKPIETIVQSMKGFQITPQTAKQLNSGEKECATQDSGTNEICPRASFPESSHRDSCYLPLFRGTLAPARRASESPMAIACLRLVTFFPERPLFKVPRLRSCIALLTF
jgi:hypothetical protein